MRRSPSLISDALATKNSAMKRSPNHGPVGWVELLRNPPTAMMGFARAQPILPVPTSGRPTPRLAFDGHDCRLSAGNAIIVLILLVAAPGAEMPQRALARNRQELSSFV